jgi:AcrR family transcriptional regulator
MSQAERMALLKRTELVEAAVAELVSGGWRGLRMQAVADRVGVSRQTVYNTFGTRDRLAAALVEHLTESFLTGFEATCTVTERTNLDRLRSGIRYLLERGSSDQALRAMLGADTGDEFLHLLTSRSGPLVGTARARIASVIRDHDAEVPTEQARAAAEIITRLTLSHIVQPVDSVESSTEVIATMVSGYLDQQRREEPSAGPESQDPAP